MKYIIGVDVDSVLRDFPHDLVRVIKREHPEWYNEDYPVPDQWEMEKCFNVRKYTIPMKTQNQLHRTN